MSGVPETGRRHPTRGPKQTGAGLLTVSNGHDLEAPYHHSGCREWWNIDAAMSRAHERQTATIFGSQMAPRDDA